MYFIGYTTQHSGNVYRMLDLKTKTVKLSRDITWLDQPYGAYMKQEHSLYKHIQRENGEDDEDDDDDEDNNDIGISTVEENDIEENKDETDTENKDETDTVEENDIEENKDETDTENKDETDTEIQMQNILQKYKRPLLRMKQKYKKTVKK
jgi:hypothetical protein